jgi:uncharacterized protein involved in outer membrane biogenesis
VTGAGVVAVIGAAVFASGQSDRLRAALAKALGRDVRVEGLGLSGLGVAFSDVRIADEPDREAGEPFVRARRLAMRLSLLGLIRRRLVVDRVVLDEPVVNLVRDPAGG